MISYGIPSVCPPYRMRADTWILLLPNQLNTSKQLSNIILYTLPLKKWDCIWDKTVNLFDDIWMKVQSIIMFSSSWYPREYEKICTIIMYVNWHHRINLRRSASHWREIQSFVMYLYIETLLLYDYTAWRGKHTAYWAYHSMYAHIICTKMCIFTI